MNRTKIEWVRGPNGEPGYTWNPLSGCLRACQYCYAARIYKRFKRSFEPTFHEDRMGQPSRVKKPARIFVCSVADLFAPWVPDDWVNRVLTAASLCEQHEFLFLTKSAQRYDDFLLPANAWAGVTLTSQADADERIPYLLETPARVRFLSCEPLLGPIDLHEHLLNWYVCDPVIGRIGWIIIGGLTNGGTFYPPQSEWVERIMEQADFFRIPVFVKSNVGVHSERQEFPHG